MYAMRLERPGAPLKYEVLPELRPGPGEVRIRVAACGVCRTDLHIIDGELPPLSAPLTPGHEIVGYVDEIGAGVAHVRAKERVGVGWLGGVCGHCRYCGAGQENLCDQPVFTGYTRDGGYATHALADAGFVYALPAALGGDVEVAPLLCAGLIGWRALRAAGDGETIGLYGFGAAAHIALQVLKWQGRRVFVFTRGGDGASQRFARALGADWAGGSDDSPAEQLDAAILYAPVGSLAPAALRAVRKGGRVICAGIHMSDIPSFPYKILWGERALMSVANLTRRDAEEFLDIAVRARIKTQTNPYPLAQANEALDDLRAGRFQGAAVLLP